MRIDVRPGIRRIPLIIQYQFRWVDNRLFLGIIADIERIGFPLHFGGIGADMMVDRSREDTMENDHLEKKIKAQKRSRRFFASGGILG